MVRSGVQAGAGAADVVWARDLEGVISGRGDVLGGGIEFVVEGVGGNAWVFWEGEDWRDACRVSVYMN